MAAPYPWLEDSWRALLRAARSGREGHALLLTSAPGSGKQALARAFAGFTLCLEPTTDGPCGHCRGCVLFAAGTHPDYLEVGPESEGKEITVDRVRVVREFFTLKPTFGSRRVTVISPAERMNRSAANALLKTLEEPPSGAALILCANDFSRVPITIRSRCQRLRIDRHDRTAAVHWLTANLPSTTAEAAEVLLQQARGAPLAAAALAGAGLADIPARVRAALDKLEQGQAFALLAAADLADLPIAAVLSEMAAALHQSAVDEADAGRLNETRFRLHSRHLHHAFDVVCDYSGMVARGAPLRPADVLEGVMLGVAAALAGR